MAKAKQKQRKTGKTKPKSAAKTKNRGGKTANPPMTVEVASAMEATVQEVVDSTTAAPRLAPPAPVRVRIHANMLYQTQSRSSAIVTRSNGKHVEFITFMDGIVEHRTWNVDRFAHLFEFALPDYPVRRAARVYLNSYFEKTEDAKRILNAILRS